MVQFRVYKASTFLFECESIQTHPPSLSDLCYRTEEFDNLLNEDIKILNRIHPKSIPDFLSTRVVNNLPPMSNLVKAKSRNDEENFASFRQYLVELDRAGMGRLENGKMAFLLPVVGYENVLQCMVAEVFIKVEISSPPIHIKEEPNIFDSGPMLYDMTEDFVPVKMEIEERISERQKQLPIYEGHGDMDQNSQHLNDASMDLVPKENWNDLRADGAKFNAVYQDVLSKWMHNLEQI